ncbi:MAG TPA: molybdopterin-binding oxidoreductase, partial [Methanoregulaceae archaeon]|nr:molybdopterin-binding oxidoreductase [Methanoregulaceae archaeon]
MALSRTIVLSVTILVFSLVLAGCTAPVQDSLAVDWRLTINGTTEKVLTMKDVRALPPVNGHGYCVSTTGFRFGP